VCEPMGIKSSPKELFVSGGGESISKRERGGGNVERKQWRGKGRKET
jgi:hypothetical protein